MKTKSKALVTALRVLASALLGIPVLLLCSCAGTPTRHYSLPPKGTPQPADQAIFRTAQGLVGKPYVKIDGHYFSMGPDLGQTLHYVFLQPFTEPPKRSLEVRLLPGPHTVEVAVAYNGCWSLPFNAGRTINFEADPGKSYELQVKLIRFKDQNATGNIEWGTKIIELDTHREFEPAPASIGEQAKF
jgi:hypothetical protein